MLGPPQLPPCSFSLLPGALGVPSVPLHLSVLNRQWNYLAPHTAVQSLLAHFLLDLSKRVCCTIQCLPHIQPQVRVTLIPCLGLPWLVLHTALARIFLAFSVSCPLSPLYSHFWSKRLLSLPESPSGQGSELFFLCPVLFPTPKLCCSFSSDCLLFVFVSINTPMFGTEFLLLSPHSSRLYHFPSFILLASRFPFLAH